MKMAKKQGLNTVQTYVFWNIHEQKENVATRHVTSLFFSEKTGLS
jgi:beta-galactosidase GanA